MTRVSIRRGRVDSTGLAFSSDHGSATGIPACLLVLVILIGCRATEEQATTPEATARQEEQLMKFVGLRFRELPKGYEPLGGALLSPLDNVEYALQHISGAEGEMLWLERLSDRDARGKPLREVMAVLGVPPITATERLVFYPTCQVNGVEDPEVIAILEGCSGEEEFDERLRPSKRAWRVNRQQGAFEAIAAEGVFCRCIG